MAHPDACGFHSIRTDIQNILQLKVMNNPVLTDALDHNESHQCRNQRNNTEFHEASLNIFNRGVKQHTTRFCRDSPSSGIMFGRALKSDILFARSERGTWKLELNHRDYE